MKFRARLINKQWILQIDNSAAGIALTSKSKVMNYILKHYLKGAVAFDGTLNIEYKEVKE